jgi:hypothetical protein
MKKSVSQKQLTYEDIARKYDMTPAKAHSIVKQAYNKMVKALMERENINIFDAVLALREYFNMSEEEAVNKLNDEHKLLLKNYAIKEFDIRSKKGKGLTLS